ncbi:MAG: Rrf2 family transcriptional regulator [candidate division WOR-3 bacterium]|nr:MAG: Rrf2 family transcriptional regulator [candidate division WOR-3 bacterium]
MRLTTKTRYALRALVELANQPDNGVLSLSVIARRQRVKPKYLEQILFKLRRSRLIKGKKGPGGGFILSRDPRDIRLKEILDAVGESTAPVQCVLGKADRYCSQNALCPMQECWHELKKRLDSFFNSYTLNDVCENSNRKKSKKRSRYGER